jgi:glycosyltransferase involved in cell wall biosynthesis
MMTPLYRILCLSRAYPPVIGGIERQNHELFTSLSRIAEVKIIANRHGKKNLPFFIPLVLLRTLILLPRYDAILLGDGMLSIIGWVIKLLSNKKVMCIVHGLDVTFINHIYQYFWVDCFLPRVDLIVAVSEATRRECIRRGLPAGKVEVIPNGVYLNSFFCEVDQGDLIAMPGKANGNRKIILTVGRLVRRKGVAWFIKSVMPRLSEDVIYLVVGDGEDRPIIERVIMENKLNNRVFLLGHVDEDQKKKIYAVTDLYIQPNIKVTGDIEGFGLVVLEAGASCTWVIAARLEGLQEAVREGMNGVLVEAENEDEFVRQINKYLMNNALRLELGKKARVFVGEQFEWHRIARRYLDLMTRPAS